MNNKELITKFYQSFSEGNAEGMIDCYHDEIEFQDPAFGKIKGDDAKNMWRMLLESGSSKIDFSNVTADETKGSASWRAEYNYGPKKRKVINNITASFDFKDGKIIKHVDHFSMWKWSQQALGLGGYLLGWTPIIKSKVQSTTKSLLKKYSENV